jgi:hypothetical protein
MMAPFEGVVMAYLVFFVLAAPFTPVDGRRRARTVFAAGACAGAVYGASQLLPMSVRLWLPFLYIPIGYWMPVALVRSRRGGSFEASLLRSDNALRGIGVALPRWFANVVEVAYLFCFPLVPVAFAVVWIAGTPLDVAGYWRAVLSAGLSSYVTLPWLVSRPPRFIENTGANAPPSASLASRANVFVLGRVSHHLNTFPSGHVAVSVAAAIATGAVVPAAGVVFGTIAAGVAIGAVAGRYHYIADVGLGLIVGIVAGAFAIT